MSSRFPGVVFYRPERCSVDGESNVSIGAHTRLDAVRILNWDQRIAVRIGRYCSIGMETVIVGGGEHRTDYFTTFSAWSHCAVDEPGELRGKGDVSIGHDVWIGVRCVVLSGVSIGTGAVVGAGSVVTRNVAPFSIVAGAPARPIGWRFGEDHQQLLLRARWWEEEPSWFEAMAPVLKRGWRASENRELREALEGLARRKAGA